MVKKKLGILRILGIILISAIALFFVLKASITGSII